MNAVKPAKTRRFPFRGLSIQQRLPLLICVLLLCTIITFSWTSYLGVKKAALKVGQDRIHTLTAQLSSMFGQSGPTLNTATANSAAQGSIKNFIHSGGKESDTAALNVLQKLQLDSTWVSVELLNADREPILQSGKLDLGKDLSLDAVITSLSLQDGNSKIGKLYAIRDSIYYPVVAPVTEKDQVIGYLVRWRLQLATQKALLQFSQLLGTNSILYIGNTDGSLWTNLIKPVPRPVADTGQLKDFFYFSPPESDRVIATAQPIPNTSWVVLVGFPKKTILESSNQFLRSIILIGAILVVIGIFFAWIMSRNITRPLKKLTVAASVIAAGDHSSPVQVERRDELGKLAHAFNVMMVHVHTAKLDLEKKVQERTAQLESANKELEAFSYSVSHDLRAPLRAISGYANILIEEYGSTLDDEAKRITDRIISNSKMMGQLIDDLIAFSQMNVKEVLPNKIDMKKLVASCMEELLYHEPPDKYQVLIHPLAPCEGDKNLIKQVWTNLISNAIKYSSKQEVPRIEIGCTEGPHFNTYFIRDNGVGFEKHHAHKLFGVFQRLHSHKEFEGTGIGLAFAKRIITKHKGEIWAESSLGEGAVFYFTVPASKVTKDVFRKPTLNEANI